MLTGYLHYMNSSLLPDQVKEQECDCQKERIVKRQDCEPSPHVAGWPGVEDDGSQAHALR